MKIYLKKNNIRFGYDDATTQLENEIKLIDKTINKYEKLNNINKYKLLEHFYLFCVEDKDLTEFINIKYNKNFNKIISISTKMEEQYIVTEGCGNNINWSMEKYRIIFRCATNDDFNLEDKKYSREEILNLIEQSKIYLIDYSSKKIKDFSEDREKFKNVPSLISKEIKFQKNIYGYALQLIKNEDKNIIMELINRELNPSKLFNNLKIYTQNIINKIEELKYFSTVGEIRIKPKVIQLYKNNFKDKNNT